MGFFRNLFGPSSQDNSSYEAKKTSCPGEGYVSQLSLDKFELTDDEQAAIGDYFDFYRKHGGEILPVSPEEMITYREKLDPELFAEMLVLWQNRHSDIAGVFYRGPLRGKVFIISHDVNYWGPSFRNIVGFTKAIMDGTLENIESVDSGEYDYPSPNLPQAEQAENLQRALELLERMGAWDPLDNRYVITAIQACAIMPQTHLHLLTTLLWDADFYVQEAACFTFSAMSYAEGLDELTKLANSDAHPQAVNAAKRAIHNIRKKAWTKKQSKNVTG